MERKNELTDAEWSLMECLWEAAPVTGREAAEYMQKRTGWSRSTTLTLLRRLEKKGAVTATTDHLMLFSPAIRREDAALQGTKSLLERAFHGSLPLLVSAMAQKEALSDEEVQALYAILDEMEAKKG